MINDVYSSIEYVEANYAIDAENVGIFGYSMGGRIAATMVGENKVNFKGMVLLAPAVDDDLYTHIITLSLIHIYGRIGKHKMVNCIEVAEYSQSSAY